MGSLWCFVGGGFRIFLQLEVGGWDVGRGNQRGYFCCYFVLFFILQNFSFCDCDFLLIIMVELYVNVLYILIGFNFFCSKVGLL